MMKQHGAALIIVLFVVALAASLAVEMNARLMVQVQKSSNLVLFQQAKWYAFGAEALAKQALKESKKDAPDVIHLKQVWAEKETEYPVEDGTIRGKITDLQACLNLNALRADDDKSSEPGKKKQSAARTYLRLLKKIEDMPIEETEEALVDGLADWLDKDSIPRGQGVEEGEYMSYELPYMTANHFVASTSELRVIRGYNPLVMEKIAPYVCVIPQSDLFQINVNTILAEQSLLLAALLDIEQSSADALISARPDEGWTDVKAFMNDAKANNAKDIDEKDTRFAVDSKYFQLAATATYGEATFKMSSTLYVKDKDSVTVLARRFGGVQ